MCLDSVSVLLNLWKIVLKIFFWPVVKTLFQYWGERLSGITLKVEMKPCRLNMVTKDKRKKKPLQKNKSVNYKILLKKQTQKVIRIHTHVAFVVIWCKKTS